LGLANEQGPWLNRPLPERMAYALTKQGRVRSEEIARASTRYAGPAPVSMSEYRTVLAEAAKPGTLDMVKVNIALAGIELAPGVEPADRQALAPHRAPDGAGWRRVPARDVRPDLRGRQPYLRSASAGEGQRRRAVDRRSRSPARRAEADPRPPAGASGAGDRLHEPCQQRAQGRDSVLGAAGAFDEPEARRAARRGLLAAPVLQGPDARPDVGHVWPHLRAGAGA